jgi:peptidase S41-like protein
MRRHVALALCAAATIQSRSAAAQAPAAPAIPNTAAGQVLRLWLDAFNSADTARMAAYVREHQPGRNVANELQLSRSSGGFDLVSIERSEPRQVAFVVKERRSPMTVYGALLVSDTMPGRVTDFTLLALGPNGTPASTRIDAATRTRVIDGAIAKLEEFYVFPETAKRMGDSLRARRARGAYDTEEYGITFALRLHNELRAISHDKHLAVRYSVRELPPQPATPPTPTPDQIARRQQMMDDMNCGFVKVEQLEGNVGYLKFNMFADPEPCGATASAAMNFLAGTRALIVDMRENGGGSPAMVTHVSSYLFPQRTHLNDLWDRKTGGTKEFWTDTAVPGRKFGGEKPVYVLTSTRTFSGAEEFSYNLKARKRATLIGEVTGGGAHPVATRRIDAHFAIAVPGARAINPITRTNWEGVGVEPDVKVPADDALATAQRMIREKPRP